jgi:hypothetical protein
MPLRVMVVEEHPRHRAVYSPSEIAQRRDLAPLERRPHLVAVAEDEHLARPRVFAHRDRLAALVDHLVVALHRRAETPHDRGHVVGRQVLDRVDPEAVDSRDEVVEVCRDRPAQSDPVSRSARLTNSQVCTWARFW